ncbi:MAG: DUF1501 domain-containing protein, partial [Pyrinomonadaceae bacterium]|nr:DUF1501 domain-containing protein [Phycisphaerales bacterium]
MKVFNMTHPLRELDLNLTRRQLFGRAALGVGTAAMAHLMGPSLSASPHITGATGIHPAPKAKRVIYLVMSEGPSQHDMWDYKPKMNDLYGKPLPEEVRDGQRITGMTSGQGILPVCPSKYKFTHYANNDKGIWVSELLPHTAGVVKELCVIHSAFTEAINHDPAITFFQTGSQVPGRPSLGAWLSYGLGSTNQNLPAYIVMHAHSKHAEQSLFNRLWGTGFLPADHQGVLLRSQGDGVLYLNNPAGVTRSDRRNQLDALAAINQAHHERFGDPEILARIKQHEMAFRMQASVPELMDLSGESDETFKLYGSDSRKPGTFAACALNARRLAERGVPIIQIFHRGWDSHGNLAGEHGDQCKDIDQACAGLIMDLKQRGMLDDTLVVWAGEFGRTAYCQGNLTKENYGRDHHPRCFTVWMAGGGVKGGITIGETDDFSYNVAKDPVHVHDLHATILHLMG